MLTYTFSTREKIMLAVLAFVGVIIVWYQFVFVNIQSQLSSLDQQISSVQDEITVNQTRAASLNTMKETVAKYQAQGLTVALLPAYDNTQNLMAYLNGVLSSAQGYSMQFDTPELSEDDGTMHRSGLITFTTGSYAEARSIAEAIARGPYPCEINSLGITDKSADGSKTSDAPVSASVGVTFFEKATSNANTAKKDNKGAVEGQDLSQLGEMYHSM